MKAIFIGCVESSKVFLEEILSTNKISIVGVVTKEKSTLNSDFADLTGICQKNNIPTFFYENKNNDADMLSWIQQLKPEIGFCFGWSHLLPLDLLKIPPIGIMGYHPAELPKNRGRHPIIWPLALGLEQTASSFFMIDEGADSGDIVSQKLLAISEKDDAQSLYDKLMSLGRLQIKEICLSLSHHTLKPIPQDHSKATYWRKRTERDGQIDWRMSSKAIYNLIRALAPPYPGAFFKLKETNVIVWKAEIFDVPSFSNVEPGKILDIQNSYIVVKTYDGALKITSFETTTPLPSAGEYL